MIMLTKHTNTTLLQISAHVAFPLKIFVTFVFLRTNKALITTHSEKLSIILSFFPFKTSTQEINCCLPLIKY